MKTLLTLLALLAGATGARSADGWETLSGCRLASNEYYDGDSFHVLADGKDKIFRLYAVDTAETNDEFPERVREQAEFFGAKKEAVLAAGQQAEELTRRLLQKPFTVETKWIDARGNSRQQRFFAKITLGDGSDLGLRLVQAGLARSYGMRDDLPQSYLAQLDRAQDSARRARLGVWGGGKTQLALPPPVEENQAEPTEQVDDAMNGSQSIFDRLQQEGAAGVQ